MSLSAPGAFLCLTCGTQFPASETLPPSCPICEDDRQYVRAGGQEWTTLAAIRETHANRFEPVANEPGVTRIVTEPKFAIGQNAYLIETPHGNILWDCIALIDDATIEEITRRGGIQAIAISHAHYYTTMIEWSLAFDAPIFLHEANREWVMRPDPRVQFWNGDTVAPVPGCTVIRTGGHFPGAMVMHWDNNEGDGKGVLFTGDIVRVVSDPRWLTFMYSYPNDIPLDAATVARMTTQLAPYRFDRIHDAFDSHVVADANERVQQSAERYIRHIRGEAGPTIA